MPADLTRIERAAWDAARHDQSSWGAVKRALAVVRPIIADQAIAKVRRTETADQYWEARAIKPVGLFLADAATYSDAAGMLEVEPQWSLI